MKLSQKNEIRLFILNQLDSNIYRHRLANLAEEVGADDLDVMEFFENEVARINKLFNYPGQ